MVKTFKVGDKVFAKVKGYPHWPARIVEDKGKKYGVIFYGTQETGNIKAEDIVYYLKNKEQFLKNAKRAGYSDALEQIAAAVKKDGGDGDTSSADDSIAKIVDESMDTSDTSISTPKSTEKNENKRKVSTASEEVTPAIGTKSARGRKSAVIDVKETENADSTPKKTKRKTGSLAKENIKEEEKNDESTPDEKDEPSPTKKPRGRPSASAKEKGKAVVKAGSKSGESSELKESSKTNIVTEPEFVSTGDSDETAIIDVKEENLFREEDVVPVVENKSAKVETLVKPNIVIEKLLKNNILYADHVRKNEALYKSQPVEPRPEDSEKQLLAVTLPSGTVCGIKLHKKWPLEFESEYERALYDETVAKAALSDRDKLISGEITELADPEMFVKDIEVSADYVKEVAYKSDIDSKKKRIDRLTVEANMVSLDAKIKQCLGLEAADPEAALGYLKDMLKIKFDELMLKKHVHVVDMIRRLQKYIGNTKEWNMGDEEIEEFQKRAEKIRLEAEKVYNKIKETVEVPESGGTFWDNFQEIVVKFREGCKDLTEAELYVLCAEPYSRKAFIDKLEEISTETVISNGVSNSEAVLNKNEENATSVQGWAEKS